MIDSRIRYGGLFCSVGFSVQQTGSRPAARCNSHASERRISSPAFPPFSSADMEEGGATRPSTSARWGSNERARARRLDTGCLEKSVYTVWTPFSTASRIGLDFDDNLIWHPLYVCDAIHFYRRNCHSSRVIFPLSIVEYFHSIILCESFFYVLHKNKFTPIDWNIYFYELYIFRSENLFLVIPTVPVLSLSLSEILL